MNSNAQDSGNRREPIDLLNMGEGIYPFVITGGPCSGKTTGMARLSQMLSERGYKVLIVPEAATILINAGVFYGEGHLSSFEFQKLVLEQILQLEQHIFSAAVQYRNAGEKVVFLCDRGTIDGEAYVGETQYAEVIKSIGRTYVELSIHRYLAVLHMRTAALGKEEFYTLANNSARIETPEQARAIDQKTLEAWLRNHSHVRDIDNSTDFDTKIRRLCAEVMSVIGDPVPVERERKFLAEWIDPDRITVPYSRWKITQDYLVSSKPGETARVRRRENDGGVAYYHTVKMPKGIGECVEVERIIDERTYNTLMMSKDPHLRTIVKNRYCFFWKHGHFELDYFVSPNLSSLAGFEAVLLEAERLTVDEEVKTPDFLKVVEEVTENPAYSNSSIARDHERPLAESA